MRQHRISLSTVMVSFNTPSRGIFPEAGDRATVALAAASRESQIEQVLRTSARSPQTAQPSRRSQRPSPCRAPAPSHGSYRRERRFRAATQARILPSASAVRPLLIGRSSALENVDVGPICAEEVRWAPWPPRLPERNINRIRTVQNTNHAPATMLYKSNVNSVVAQ